GGNRRCIMVTNNEVSDAEEKNLRRAGYTPNDDEWQKLGIARYVTWPRTVCSIEGHNINGEPLKGKYLDTEIEMADGFKANAAYFKLGFLNKDYVEMGRNFKEILPLLWFQAGCRGACPSLADEKDLPPMLILRENNFAVLIDESYYSEFEQVITAEPSIDTIFISTKSNYGYRQIISNFKDKVTYQLYQDYLDNFKISG
ncbi:MAG: site-specific DNA-methyltransferase, partial [Selenomonadaceae bacterium]|nr:site-specific DNA-methyltransferase [Selenomonadaceae bacterium]